MFFSIIFRLKNLVQMILSIICCQEDPVHMLFYVILRLRNKMLILSSVAFRQRNGL
jgi:hypothetical protein